MIECPQCAAKLPDWTQACQFCQADTRGVIRAPAYNAFTSSNRSSFEPPKWVWGAYYGISALYVVQGLYSVAMGIYEVSSPKSHFSSFFATIELVIGAVTALLGLGLLARIEFVRGIINFFCGIQILLGILGLAGSVFGAMILGPLGLLMMFMNVLKIATAAFMIYLIGETDRAAPNF